MSITSSLGQKVVGQIQVDPANGYIAPLGIEYPDGTTQITAFPNQLEPTLKATFATDAAQASGGSKDNTAVNATFTTPYEDKSGGVYMAEIRGAIGGSSTTWAGAAADNETITVRIRVQLNGSVAPTASDQCGWVGTITKSFAQTQLPTIGFQTQFELPVLPAGENWVSATLEFGMASSDPASTSTIQRTAFDAYFYKLS